MLLPQQYPTLYDLAAMPSNADAREIINMLAQMNPILEDAPAFPMNKGTHHETTVLTGLPTVTWGKLYKGIPASKGSRQTVQDTAGFVESASEVDTRLVDDLEKAEDKASIRAQEAQLHIEAMSQEAARAIIYHDSSVDPAKPMGLAPRFNSLSAENGQQIIDAGGTGNDLTSIWMITWGSGGTHLIYPKGTSAGLRRKDRGAIPKEDANGDTYFVYREEFSWFFGLTVRNWQYISRVANIDTGDLTNNAATGANINNLMTEMYYVHKGRRMANGKTYIYANTTIVKYLDYQSRLATNQNLFLTWDKAGPNAKEILNFRGIPLRETDAILNTEEEVL